jgi:Lon-like ATP-dependent protease
MSLQMILLIVQLLLLLVFIGYFVRVVRSQNQQRSVIFRDSHRQLEKWQELRKLKLKKSLAESTRPSSLHEVIGQEQGIRLLRAALCGTNPQHVIIYGPPGIGKTAAARLVLEEAKLNTDSPFRSDAPFVEVDSTIVRFDERGIADPLLGTIHDPIYQGAGAMGVAGVPQPKPGAVTKAHGGVLFLDEIGELHPHQMNKLLKVLEDGKVTLESSYYSPENKQIPPHIHDQFEHGLPADFRLIGATTRAPEDLPAALRSRCVEIFFRSLNERDVAEIANGALQKANVPHDQSVIEQIVRYAHNGRDANHLVQLAGSVAYMENMERVSTDLIEWLAVSAKLTPRPTHRVTIREQIGVVNGLAVGGSGQGFLMPVEVEVMPAALQDQGRFEWTGIVEEEQIGGRERSLKRQSMARTSLQNVATALRKAGYQLQQYDIHLNIPGGLVVDGPSAGITMAVAIASALSHYPIAADLAMTGELSCRGLVLPVGGIAEKLEAALSAGIKRVYISVENERSVPETIRQSPLEVIAVESLAQLFSHLWGLQSVQSKHIS